MHNKTIYNKSIPSVPKTGAELKHILKNEWTLSPYLIDSCLLKYYILYWNSDYFFTQLQYNSDGTITKEGVTYSVYFHRCTLEDCIASSHQIVLSFRMALTSFGIYPVVLVSCAKSASATAKAREHTHARDSRYGSNKHSEHPHIKEKK